MTLWGRGVLICDVHVSYLGLLGTQGLFHPARKVRNVYWRIYNNMYVASQDAMIAVYPSFDDEPKNSYHRHELDLFL